MTIAAIDVARDENFEGYLHGSQVSIIREYSSKPGIRAAASSAPLHGDVSSSARGRALFTVGDDQLVGVGGQVLVVPALIAHRFEVLDGGT